MSNIYSHTYAWGLGLGLGLALVASSACSDSSPTTTAGMNETTTLPSSSASGDGDGDSASGDGDGDSSSGDGDGDATTDPTTDSMSGDGDGDDASTSSAGPKFDTLSTGDAGSCTGELDATLTGTVHAPNGEVPVSGALVYTTGIEPEGIPQEVYCAECEEIDPCVSYRFTEADGSFSLPANVGPNRYLVVVKGQFMRITQLNVAAGVTALDPELTDLPGVSDPDNGQYIPLIALGMSSPDRFQHILGKMGLGEVGGNGDIVPTTEHFELWANGVSPGSYGFTSQGDMSTLLNDPDRLAQYHILFIPCIGGPGFSELQNNPQAVENLREWVAAGGRIYATDYGQSWIELLFPDYQKFNGEPGNPTPVGSFDSLATVLDEDLLAWLEALPEPLEDVNPLNGGGNFWPTLNQLPLVNIIDNYTGIELPLPEILADDGMGGEINIGHQAWLEGPWPGAGDTYPPSVIGQYGCGRLHFTSYHTAGSSHVGLIPQELIMLYSILEVGVCQVAVPAG